MQVFEKELDSIVDHCKNENGYLYSDIDLSQYFTNPLSLSNYKYFKLKKENGNYILFNLKTKLNEFSFDEKNNNLFLENYFNNSNFLEKYKILDDINFFGYLNEKTNDFRKRNILSCFKLVNISFELNENINFTETVNPIVIITDEVNTKFKLSSERFKKRARFQSVGIKRNYENSSEFKNEIYKKNITKDIIKSFNQLQKYKLSFEKLFLYFCYYVKKSFNVNDNYNFLENYSETIQSLFKDFESIKSEYFCENELDNIYYLHINLSFDVKNDIVCDLSEKFDIINYNKVFINENKKLSYNLTKNMELEFLAEHYNKRFFSYVIDDFFIDSLNGFSNIEKFTEEKILKELKNRFFEVIDFDNDYVWINEFNTVINNSNFRLISRVEYANSINMEQLILFINSFKSMYPVQLKIEQYTALQRAEKELKKKIEVEALLKRRIEMKTKFDLVNKKINKVAIIETVEEFKKDLIVNFENNIKQLERIIYIYEVNENNEDNYSCHYTITLKINILSKSFSGDYMIDLFFNDLGSTSNDSLKHKKNSFYLHSNQKILLSNFNDLYSNLIEKAESENIKLNIDIYKLINDKNDLQNVFKIFCSKVSLSQKV